MTGDRPVVTVYKDADGQWRATLEGEDDTDLPLPAGSYGARAAIRATRDGLHTRLITVGDFTQTADDTWTAELDGYHGTD